MHDGWIMVPEVTPNNGVGVHILNGAEMAHLLRLQEKKRE